jgi:hypothetical protein
MGSGGRVEGELVVFFGGEGFDGDLAGGGLVEDELDAAGVGEGE